MLSMLSVGGERRYGRGVRGGRGRNAGRGVSQRQVLSSTSPRQLQGWPPSSTAPARQDKRKDGRSCETNSSYAMTGKLWGDLEINHSEVLGPEEPGDTQLNSL